MSIRNPLSMNFTEIKDAIFNFFTSKAFTSLVNLVSIISLLITIQVYFHIKKIERFYMFIGRIPDLAKNLQTHASNIIEYLNDNDFEKNISQLDVEFVRVAVTLDSLRKKTDGELKQSISKVLKEIKERNLKVKGSEGARSIHLSIVKIQAEIVDLQKDQKWRS